MRHQITIHEAAEALDTEIIVASATSSKLGKKKRITFNPSDLLYTVTYSGKTEVDHHSYVDPLIAIEIYNDYNV